MPPEDHVPRRQRRSFHDVRLDELVMKFIPIFDLREEPGPGLPDRRGHSLAPAKRVTLARTCWWRKPNRWEFVNLASIGR
jgi:hypothetical protein